MSRSANGDRGTISFFVVGCVVGLFALSGLTFDGGGKVRQAERTDAVAREAARAACEQINRLTVLGSGQYVLYKKWADKAGRAYVSIASANDRVIYRGFRLSYPAPHVCQVRLTADYRTYLLGMIGIDSLPVTGTGQAQFVYGVKTKEG